jgi:hypothetical protein
MNVQISKITGLFLSLFFFMATADAQPKGDGKFNFTKLVDLDVKMNTQTKVIGNDGVIRTTYLDEHFVRKGPAAWIERVIPSIVPAKKKHASGTGHEHFDPLEGARLVELDKDQLRLSFVQTEDKVRIGIPKSEYPSIGFDGSWERAYYMMTPQEYAALKPTERVSTVPEAKWYEGNDKENYLRILIDFKNAIPLVIERGNFIGTRSLKITLSPQALKDIPVDWKNIHKLTPKVFSDYAD